MCWKDFCFPAMLGVNKLNLFLNKLNFCIDQILWHWQLIILTSNLFAISTIVRQNVQNRILKMKRNTLPRLIDCITISSDVNVENKKISTLRTLFGVFKPRVHLWCSTRAYPGAEVENQINNLWPLN